MSAHDVYVISPYMSMAGVAILVILLDLVVARKGWLPVFAFLGLLVPLGLSLVQVFDGSPLIPRPVPDRVGVAARNVRRAK